jgi:outer membrane putative beta-barrel porin/alpha-amylase
MRIYSACGAQSSAVVARLLWSLLGAGVCISCQADDHIDTDGPDFVDSSEVVGKGRFQFEANLQYQQQHTGATHEQLVGTPTLFRFGLTDAVEARVEIGGRQRLQTRDSLTPTEVASGWADNAIGAKWHFQSPDAEGHPSACLIYQVETPSGSAPFRGHGYRPSLRSVITWDLTETVSASIMPGAAYSATSNGHRYPAGSFGATIGRWWTEQFRAFVEFSGEQFAQAKDGGNILLWDAGASYLLGLNWELGMRLGVGANANSPGFFGLVMFAGRF